MRLRGPHLIGQFNLNTSDFGQSGTVFGFNIVVIVTNGWAPIMDIVAETAGQVINRVTMVSGPAPDANRDTAREVIINPNTTPRAYDAEWREINP